MPRPLPPGTWPKASDEADGNAGRPQAWFFPDHRQKIFRTLPITGEKYFVPYRSQAKPILVFSGSQAKPISYSTEHRQKLFCTLPITGKTYFGFFRITGKNHFVLYRAQAKTISYSTEHRQNLFRTLEGLPITLASHYPSHP